MKQFTIERTTAETYTNLYTATFNDTDAEELTKEIKEKYQVADDFEVTLKDIYDVMEDQGNFDEERNIELINKDGVKLTWTYNLFDYIQEYVNDIIWNVEPEYIDSEIDYSEDSIGSIFQSIE